MDNDPNKTALYEKPRRLVQNQTAIVLLAVAVNVVSLLIPAIAFKLYEILF